MRYYLDTEFNGFGGALLSLALVPEDGDEFYLALACDEPIVPWVAEHVVPYTDHVPIGLRSARLDRTAAAAALAAYLASDPAPEIIADWPDDIAYLLQLLTIAPGQMVPVPQITFRLVPLPGFSTAENSAVPHNALHDARALREHLLALE